MAARERLQVVLELVAGQYKREAKAAATATGQVADAASRAGTATGGMTKQWSSFTKLAAAAGVGVLAKQLKDLAVESVKLAIDAEEAAAAFDTTFGAAVGQAGRFVEEFAVKAGFTTGTLKQMLAVTGNVAQGLGATETESAALAESMAVLAGDVASFSNATGGAEAVLGALQSAISGEREALKTYGLAISEAEVQQRALNDTGKQSVAQLTRLDKATATVAVAYDKAGKAVGDLDRTQDSAANTLRRMNALWDEAKTELGQGMLPAIQDALPALESLVRTTAAFAEAIGPQLGDAIQIGVRGMEGAMETWLRWQALLKGDASMSAMADAVETASSIRRTFDDTYSKATKLADGLVHLEQNASLNADTFNFLAKSIGANTSEQLAAANATRDWILAHEPGVSVESLDRWIAQLTATVNLEASAMRAAAIAAGDLESVFPGLASGLDRFNGVLDENAQAQKEANDAVVAGLRQTATANTALRDRQRAAYDVTNALYAQIDAENDLADVMLSAVTPLENFINKWQRHQDMFDEYNADNVLTEQEKVALAFDAIALKSASLSPHEFNLAMEAMALEMGITTEAAMELLNAYGLIDGKTVRAYVETNYTTRGSKSAPRQFQPRAQGGPVSSGSLYQVGENNRPELYMIPGDNGRVFSNSDSRALIGALSGAGGSNLTINMQSQEPNIDAQRVAAMAAIQRRMETL